MNTQAGEASRDSLGGSPEIARAEAAPALAWTLPWLLLCFATALAVGFTVVPALESASWFLRGYFIGNDYPMHAILASILYGGFIALFVPANWIFRWQVSRSSLVLAVVIQTLAVAAGIAIVDGTYAMMIRRSVARAQIAVDAIHAFERDNGFVPPTFRELVPDYLSRDPSQLFESGPGLYYYNVSTAERPSRPGEWLICSPTIGEEIRLEYAPSVLQRELTTHERRIGDWIVEARDVDSLSNLKHWAAALFR